MSGTSVSVIVPVYNGEAFLQTCAASILGQTLTELEVILVDDGSTDGSGALCDALAARDRRVRVLHQNNAGVSAARNAGLDLARGAWIGFVDADDWIEPDMLRAMLERAEAEQAEIVMCDAVTDYPDGRSEPDTITRLTGPARLTKADLQPELLLEMAGAVWRCLYRADLAARAGLRFDRKLKFSEDRLFNLRAMGSARALAYLKTGFYHRIMQPESAVHRFHADYYEAVKAAYLAQERALRELWSPFEAYARAYETQYVSGAIAAINNYFYRTSPLSLRERRAAVRRLCRDGDLVRAISRTGSGGLRGRWIAGERVGLLAAGAWLSNRKNRR